MDSRRSFSTSTLTMKDTRSRPHLERHGSRGPGMRPSQQDYGSRYTRRRSSNLSDMYKNPQIYAGLKQSSSETSWSVTKKFLLLTPTFAIQFCTVFSAVYSTINMELLGVTVGLSSLHLVISGCLSIVLIIASQKFVCKFYGEKRRNTQIFAVFMALLCIGLLMVLAANVERIFNAELIPTGDTDIVTLGNPSITPGVDSGGITVSNSTVSTNQSYLKTDLQQDVALGDSDSPESSSGATMVDSQAITTATSSLYIPSPTPLYSKIMAFLGYIIVASSLSSGHYLLLSISMSMTHTDDQASIATITNAAMAIGGCALSFLGAIDLSSSWYPSEESRYHVYGQVSILACLALVFLIGTTTCSICTWNFDAISRKLRPAPESDVDRWIAHDRRPTRTAQEIFDECAPLLGHGEPSTPETVPEISRNEYPEDTDDALSFTASQSGTITEESVFSNRPDLVRPYRLAATATTGTTTKTRSWLDIVKTQKKFGLAMLLVFFLSSSWVSLEYNSVVYLAYAAYQSQDINGLSFKKGSRVGSAGIFMIYLIFIAVYFFYDRVQQTGWKRLGLGVTLIASLLTLALALTDRVGVFFAVMCVHGLLRVVVVSLPWLLTVQTARSQFGFQTTTLKQILIECPTTIIWCLTPLSLVISSAVTSPLMDATGVHGVPVYYSTVTSVMGLVVLIVLMILN